MWPILFLLTVADPAPRPFLDKTHASANFKEARHYRIFLPAGYEGTKQRYPVIYYLHGHSDRYTLEKYDDGKDTVPKIARFVATHPVIVVAVDGYVAKSYTGFYGGSPWDVLADGGVMDFGLYFKELAAHIDATYRTKAGRRFRATSGLSMGGFMSLYLSARFPDFIGSASSFNPGPEFYTGEPGRRILWRPKDHVTGHEATMIRLIRASGDYISQYHEETREAYAIARKVNFEYRRDEYHRHWATSIGETFAFHLRAFENTGLDAKPARWHYTCAYRDCEAWGYRIQTDNPATGYIHLEDVTENSLRVQTRKWAPDGPPEAAQVITVTTDRRYRPNSTYTLRDLNREPRQVKADRSGRLALTLDGGLHQLSLEGPGLQPPDSPVLLPVAGLHLLPDVAHTLRLRIYNPRSTPLTGVRVEVTSEYPNVQIESNAVLERIEPGAIATIEPRVRLTAGEGEFQRIRLTAMGQALDLFVAPSNTVAPWQMEILDGRTVTLPVFRQKGNQGGGGAAQRTVTEGRGNGNGILEPGEQATVWVILRQGLDPFDKGNWYRAKVHCDSKWLREVGDIAEQKQLEWTGAKERTSLIELSPDAPSGVRIPVLLENESWSYHFTPDVRYGQELLYQAFQRHRRHVHSTLLP